MSGAHAHKVREHASQEAQTGSNAAAGVGRNKAPERDFPHFPKPGKYGPHGRGYLDLKRIKTDAPGWRCAAVCCVYCLPNLGRSRTQIPVKEPTHNLL